MPLGQVKPRPRMGRQHSGDDRPEKGKVRAVHAAAEIGDVDPALAPRQRVEVPGPGHRLGPAGMRQMRLAESREAAEERARADHHGAGLLRDPVRAGLFHQPELLAVEKGQAGVAGAFIHSVVDEIDQPASGPRRGQPVGPQVVAHHQTGAVRREHRRPQAAHARQQEITAGIHEIEIGGGRVRGREKPCQRSSEHAPRLPAASPRRISPGRACGVRSGPTLAASF